MIEWEPRALANRVCIIGNRTASAIDLDYFSTLEGKAFVTVDFSIHPYSQGKPIEIDDSRIYHDGKQIPLMLGYEYRLNDDRIVYSYDHHGPDPRMEKPDVCSTSLAREVMLRRKSSFDIVYVTHTDTDSILSSFILLTGNTDKQLVEAAIAADHTGEQNDIADVLQACMDLRDVEFSYGCLHAILCDRPLPEEAKRRLKVRINDRMRAIQYIKEGIIDHLGNGVYGGRFEEMLPGELLPGLIPNARAIILVSNLKPGIKEIKVRAGLKYPPGKSLNELGLPGYCGRWNAGSTKRYGGTPESEVDGFIADLVKAMGNR